MVLLGCFGRRTTDPGIASIMLFAPSGGLRRNLVAFREGLHRLARICRPFSEGFYRLAGICRPFRACSTSLGAVQPEAAVWLFSRGSQLMARSFFPAVYALTLHRYNEAVYGCFD